MLARRFLDHPKTTENLDVSKTFEDQKEFVLKTMIPFIMNVLSCDTYPLQQFLRGYLDEVTNQKSKGRNFKKHIQTYSDSQLVEEVNPPLNAPKWIISGYNGPLKRLVASIHSDDEDEGDTEKDNGHERQQRQ
ncbi:hypothetical protein RCL_jg25875.t1 [Rhizophagus clarus]|uniref:Uncharacterized protein n=1 Tax=Rhizophagus clarus TaxID=94130 RepID=A0A8H3QU60_9GLOM|nr:hypothetical protein RCL_jg25875.t1 [Rhizophagus clarus]